MMKGAFIVSPFYNKLEDGCDYAIQTCEHLAKNNIVVAFLFGESRSFKEVFVDFFRRGKTYSMIKRHNGVTYFFPLFFLPLRRFHFINSFNILANLILLRLLTLPYVFRYEKKILWIFEPFNASLYLRFFPSFLKIYDCVDYFSSVDSEVHNRIKKEEYMLIRAVDLAVVNSNTLYELYKSIRSDIAVVPQGFAVQFFTSFKNIPKRQLPFPTDKPVIGYIGGINYRLDFRLLHELVERCIDYSFVFVGPQQSFHEDTYIGTSGKLNRLFAHENVFWVDAQPKEKIPAFIHAFDVTLIPRNIDLEFNKYCYPMKLLEYFYLGKPVVSTPIQEVTMLSPLVRIGSNAEEFRQHIQLILKNGWPKKIQERQRQFAINNSWEKKLEAISSHLKRAIRK